MEYSFYVYTNKAVKDDLSLEDAIKEYKKTDTGAEYKSLGVNKGSMSSCDILNNKGKDNSDTISKDYTQLDNYKNDFLIANTVIPRLQHEFDLVK